MQLISFMHSKNPLFYTYIYSQISDVLMPSNDVLHQLLSSHGYVLHPVQHQVKVQELCRKYHRYLAPFHTHYSMRKLFMRKLASLLLTKWSVPQHRQLHRQEICFSITHGKKCLLREFIPKHSSQSANLESLINLQGDLNAFYSSKSSNPL